MAGRSLKTVYIKKYSPTISDVLVCHRYDFYLFPLHFSAFHVVQYSNITDFVVLDIGLGYQNPVSD
jgi:hypothetical protein